MFEYMLKRVYSHLISLNELWIYKYLKIYLMNKRFEDIFKAAEPVSFRYYRVRIFLFYKKLHMSKLSIKVELIP